MLIAFQVIGGSDSMKFLFFCDLQSGIILKNFEDVGASTVGRSSTGNSDSESGLEAQKGCFGCLLARRSNSKIQRVRVSFSF